MKPAFSYYGGKQRMIPHILPLIQKIPHTVYGEPFCGGAAVLFALPRRSVTNNDHYREFINDKNDWVINFYRVGQTQRNELLTLINATLYSQSEYKRASEILKDSSHHQPLDVAWAFYVNVQMSFAHTLLTGWGTGVVTRNSATTWVNAKRSLEQSLERIESVHASSEDAIRCIERWDSPHTLMYIDPPYPETDQGHYEGYTLKDWQRLCDLLDDCQCSYILSNYPQPIEPASAQQRIEVEVLCSASGKGKVRGNKTRKAKQEELGDRERTEVLWVCDRSHAIRDDLRNIARIEQLSLLTA